MPLEKVLQLYKRVGETPLERIERFKKDNPSYQSVPMTYAGRLDPMAEGLLLVLTGEECKKKQEYLELPKNYEGEILFGFDTDTGDILGLPRAGEELAELTTSNLQLATNKLLGRRMQKYPAFSSKTVKGKPLWQWARAGKEVELPEREVEIFSFEVLECRKESHSNILKNVRVSVGKVGGDFRQEEVLGRWDEVLAPLKGEAAICSFRAKVSSGTYIRSLAQDLGTRLGMSAVLYSLKRTQIGDFVAKDL